MQGEGFTSSPHQSGAGAATILWWHFGVLLTCQRVIHDPKRNIQSVALTLPLGPPRGKGTRLFI